MASRSEILDPRQDDAGTRLAAAGGVLGAVAMSSCCILPLVLFSLGATGSWIARMGAMYQYKWYIFAFAAASLGYGYFKVYRQSAPGCADAACARPVDRRILKISLWSATLIVAASLFFPYASPYVLGY